MPWLLEGAWFRKTGKLVSFSEQELVSCDTGGQDNGCQGGGPDTAFQWVIQMGVFQWSKSTHTQESRFV